MARPAKAPVIPSNSLVASAVRVDRNAARIYHKDSTDWQRECYRHYSICGEARFAARFMGNAVSRAVLSIVNDEGEAVTEGPAVDALNELFNGKAGQSQMLDAIGLHLTIAGECFLIGRTVKRKEVWEIVSVLEVEVTGKTWKVKCGDGNEIETITLTDKDVAIRIWIPRPGARIESDSPFRSLLPILTEIEWLTRHIFAQTSSRLAGAGILFLPQNMTFPPPPEVDGKAQETANEADAFMKTLADAMTTPLADPGNVAGLVPITVTAPADAIDKARLMQFWTELDAKALEMRNDAIKRFALGMDLPPEEVLGMGSNMGTGGGNSNGVSHWGAWQIEESTIKMHIEPMLDVIVNALTMVYLRPITDSDDRVKYDTSSLKLRPDRSRESIELWQMGLLKAEVPVRENGFDVEDMPDDEELKKFLLWKIAGGSATPEQVGAALKALGVDLGVEPGTDIEPRETRPDPSLEEHPSRPRTPDESALIYACDALVWRALELAGKRALNTGVRGKNRDNSIDPCEFHIITKVTDANSLLEGVFSHGPKVLGQHWERISRPLTDYCVALVAAQVPHTRDQMVEYLNRRGVFAVPTSTSPINLTVNVNGNEQPINVNLPENLIESPQINPTFELNPRFEVTTPEMQFSPHLTVEAAMGAPDVVVNVEPTPVTVENHVEPTPVTVEAPEVNVAGPNVTVEAPKVTVTPRITAKVPRTKTVREVEVLRDADGLLSGAIETEVEEEVN